LLVLRKGVVKKAVWLAVLWIVVTMAFPEIPRSMPSALLEMSYVVAGALIATAREHLITFLWALEDTLVAPLHVIYWAFEKLLDFIIGLIPDSITV